jgi:hypothetical protein
MGEVYVARDTRRGARAARLIREAQAAAALEHPNVVTVATSSAAKPSLAFVL